MVSMDTVAVTEATDRASAAVVAILGSMCSSTNFQTQGRCPTKTTLSPLIIKEWVSTARNPIISIICSIIVAIIIREAEVIAVARCTLDTAINIGTNIRNIQHTRRTAGTVGIVGVVPREDVAREVNIAVILTTMTHMGMVECITPSTTTVIPGTKINTIEVENSITETTKMIAVARFIAAPQVAIINKSTTSSITTNTPTRTLTTSTRFQWAEIRWPNSRTIT